MHKPMIYLCLFALIAHSQLLANNKIDNILGNATQTFRADDVPAGDAGRSYIPGAAAAVDNIMPSSFSRRFKIGANFKASLNMQCGQMNFYNNINAEIKRLQYKLKSTIKRAQKAILASISSAVTSQFQYLLMKINPTLGQLSLKQLDEYIELFDLKVKSCKDYERDVKNGKNPLGELVQIAVGDQWKTTIGLVNSGQKSLEEAEEQLVDEAIKNGVTMADGENYGGQGQPPVNITKSLIKAGMNLTLARQNKSSWDSNFNTSAQSVKNNPILGEFKNVNELYQFIEDIYGSTEKTLTASQASGQHVKSVAGRGYELKYVEYRNKYISALKQYIERSTDKATFKNNTGMIIPPAVIEDIRQMPPYERAVEIEQRAQQMAIKKVKENLLFAKQALKAGVYAPDLQQSGMKGPALEEYKSIYYRILDDISEISSRAYQY